MGAEADWAVVQDLVEQARRIVFYTLEGVWKTSGLPVSYEQVIDITSENQAIEREAWELSVDLARILERDAQDWSVDDTEVMRRVLFASVFKPIGQARARAALVRAAHQAVDQVTAVGVSDLEKLALQERFPRVAEGFAASSTNMESPPQPRRIPFMLKPLHKVWALSRLVAHVISERRADAQLLRPLRAMRCSRTIPCVIVMLKVEQHMRALRSTLMELRSRGWCLVLLMNQEGVSLSEESLSVFDCQVDASRLASPESIRGSICSRLKPREPIRPWIMDWCHSFGFERFADNISDSIEHLLRRSRRYLETIESVCGALRPQAILTINETHISIEPAVVAGRRRRVPTVNVQHGIITPTPLRADFRFDAFCVFGEAYADTLESLGTAPERICVVGNPFLDSAGPSAAHARFGTSHTEYPRARNSGQPHVLFAAQYSHPNLSELVLHASLTIVLEWAECDPDRQLTIKLHPVGEGKELGYQLAIAEHPDARVNVVRDGDLHDIIEQADCVATHSSTVVFDAAAVSRPTVLVDAAGVEGWREALVSEGAALAASSVEEFGECVRAVCSDEAGFQQGLSKLNKRYGSAGDDTAGSRIADVCEGLVSDNSAGDAYS